MRINAFITHKKAEYFVDCQDRFSVNVDTKSIAVSDGMGSSWQQKIWANLLAETFTSDEEWSPNKETIQNLSFRWKEEVNKFIEGLRMQLETCSEVERKQIQSQIYRNERNLAEGRSAGATLVGIRLLPNEKKCKATVLGDSCLIVWDGLKAKFLTSQETCEFDSYPDYFDSNPLKDGRGTIKKEEYKIDANTCFLLVSDPFSDFLWQRDKENKIKKYIDELISLASHEEFETLVCRWREQGMGNDDTTVVVITQNNSSKLEEGVVDRIDKFIEQEKIKKDNTPISTNLPSIPKTYNEEVNPHVLADLIYEQCKTTWQNNQNIFKHIINYISKFFRNKTRNQQESYFKDITISCIVKVLSNYHIYKKK